MWRVVDIEIFNGINQFNLILRTLTPTFCMGYIKINILFTSFLSSLDCDFNEKVDEKYIPP